MNLSGAVKAFMTFSYRRKSNTIGAGDDVYVQVASDGSTFNTIYTIAGDGTTDASYVTVFNQDITSFATANTAIRFLTAGTNSDADTRVYRPCINQVPEIPAMLYHCDRHNNYPGFL